MEIHVLRSILHKELRSWKMEEQKKHLLMEALMKAQSKTVSTVAECAAEIKLLLTEFPELGKQICLRHFKQDRQLEPLVFQSELPAYSNGFEQFYVVLITRDCMRIYNKFLDFRGYERIGAAAAALLLKKVRILAGEVSDKIKKIKRNAAFNSSDRFVLDVLRLRLRDVYFSIQELFKNHLDVLVDVQKFHLFVLHEELDDICEITKMKTSGPVPAQAPNLSKEGIVTSICFGLTADRQKMKTVLYLLCKKMGLLKDASLWEDLVEILFSESYIPGTKTIQFNWYNTELRYLIERLQPYFESLKYINIEKSEAFRDRDGHLLKATSFYQAGKGKTEVRNAKVFKEIFKELF